MSVCLSVFPSDFTEQLASYWKNFNDIWYLSIFEISVYNIQDALQFDKNNGYFARWPIYTYEHISLSS
jgi:hypothetical protein